ncbi:MAG: hypothetical protein IT457_12785 [Planctomycetes bacterium]|nr:hypothetical protein [Planctomycetota bacterium]
MQVDGTSCWTSQSGYDLDDIGTAQSNVEQAVSFVRGIYEDLNGQQNRWFDTVVLCPTDVAGGNLVLKGKQLYVGVDWGWQFGWYAYDRNAQDIRNAWTQGTHLEYEAAELKRYWKLALNPVGVPRLVLRDAVRDAASALGGLLRGRLGLGGSQLRGAMRNAITNSTMSDYRRSVNVGENGELGPSLRDEALARIETMTDEELRAFAMEWIGTVEDPANSEQMSHAVVAAHEAVARASIDLTLVQSGWVTVGNFKSIHTNVSFYLPRGGRFARYVSMQKLQHNIRVEQNATIAAVYLIDDVQTNVAVSADLGLETAGLEQAFDTFAIP